MVLSQTFIIDFISVFGAAPEIPVIAIDKEENKIVWRIFFIP